MKININFDWYLNEFLTFEVKAQNGCNACWSEWEINVKRKYEGQAEEMTSNVRFEHNPTIDDIKNSIIGYCIRNNIFYQNKVKGKTK